MVHHRKRSSDELTLTPDLLIAAYAQGVFPMAPSRHADTVHWYSPDPRAILPLDGFHLPKNIQRKVRSGVFEIHHDTAFERVMRACAQPRHGEPETWISDEIIRAYTALHQLGFAHSVETWRDGELVGGLYGVALGAAFFGESMFHQPGPGTDASKVCLAHLVDHLRRCRFELLDVQINSDHMRQFGTIDMPRRQYMRRLSHAIAQPRDWHPPQSEQEA